MPALTPLNEPFDATRPQLGSAANSARAAHYLEWIHACKGGSPASANYLFELPIVESLMLGNIAIRTQEALSWDSGSGRLTRGSAGRRAAQAVVSCSLGLAR